MTRRLWYQQGTRVDARFHHRLVPVRPVQTVVHPGASARSVGAHPAPPAAGGLSVERRAAGGALWVLLAFAVSRLLGFASNLVLARLLSPTEFGLVSFAMIAIGAFTLLQDLGTPAAIVYGRRDVREVGGTALTINLAAALALFLVLGLAAPELAALGGDAAIGPIVTALALGLVVSAIGSVQSAALVKELALRRKFLPDVVPLIASGVLSIALALAGFGVWSLVVGYLAKAVVATLMLWALSPLRPWPRFHRVIAGELLGYGQHMSFSAVLGFATMNADYFVVGHFLGAAELGLYTMAFQIATMPCKAIGELATKVVFPAYTRLGDDREALARFLIRIMRLTGMVAVPVGVAIAVPAPGYVSLLLSERWSGMVAALQVLAVFGVLQAIGYNFPAAYKALGRPKALWKFNLLKLALVVPPWLAVVAGGIAAISAVHVVAEAAVLPLYAFVLARYLGIPIGRLWQALRPPLAGGLAAGAVVALAYTAPSLAAVVREPLGSFGLTAAALAAYAVVLVALDREARALLRAGIGAPQRQVNRI
ncbi:MAG TPA: lipopolysaccharide biosynthesis protein [Chloroflexota bacterium]|nr:lipopolysaccharide biosynthesis protein [Chloroflexota bacterium]